MGPEAREGSVYSDEMKQCSTLRWGIKVGLCGEVSKSISQRLCERMLTVWILFCKDGKLFNVKNIDITDVHLKMCLITVQSVEFRDREPGFLSWLYYLLTAGSTSRGAGGRAREER